MALQDDEAEVEARFGLFGDSANINARQVHGLGRTYHKARKSFWTDPMGLVCDVGQVKYRFGPFRDSVSVGARQVHGLR